MEIWKLSKERIRKKYGICLDQKGKNPDYFPGKYVYDNI